MSGRRQRGLRVALGGALVIVLVAAAVSAAHAQPVPGRTKLRLGVAVSPMPELPNSVMWLAKDLGFYEREGLDVDVVEVQATPSILVAMRTGELDIGNLGPEDVVLLTATKQFELRAIHSPGGRNFFMVASRDTVATVADLKGKTFGISRLGGFDHTLTRDVLENKGISQQDLRLVAVGAPNVRAQALVGGRIDATTMSLATWLQIAGQARVKVLISPDDYFATAPVISKVNAVTTRTLREKPDALLRFTAAIIKTARHFASDKPAWIEAVLRRRPDSSRKNLSDLWDTFQASWAVNGTMNLWEYEKTAGFFYRGDDFRGVPRIETREWADTRFVDTVLRDLGVVVGKDDPGRRVR